MKPLDAEKLFAPADPYRLVGGDGEVLPTVASTMDVARERLHEGVPDGYVVLAEHQGSGRGRAGDWECPAGLGLLMSVVLRMGLRTGEQKLIVIMGAVAATEALRRFGVAAQIKWPNDVVVGSTGRGPLRVKKLGGLLVERVSVGDGADAHVLGLGLNVNQAEEELPPGAAVRATSMRVEQGRRFDRNEVCRAVLEELNAWYRRLAMGQPERILARWRRLSCLLGRVVRVRVEGRELGGRAIGIRSTGELIFRDETGRDLLLRDGTAQLLL